MEAATPMRVGCRFQRALVLWPPCTARAASSPSRRVARHPSRRALRRLSRVHTHESRAAGGAREGPRRRGRRVFRRPETLRARRATTLQNIMYRGHRTQGWPNPKVPWMPGRFTTMYQTANRTPSHRSGALRESLVTLTGGGVRVAVTPERQRESTHAAHGHTRIAFRFTRGLRTVYHIKNQHTQRAAGSGARAVEQNLMRAQRSQTQCKARDTRGRGVRSGVYHTRVIE